MNGFDPRVSIKISDSEAIGNIIVVIREKLGKDYSVELHKKMFEDEMIDRDYNKSIIDEWIQFID